MRLVPFKDWTVHGKWGGVNRAAKPGTLKAVVVHHQAGGFGSRNAWDQARLLEEIHHNRRNKRGGHTFGMVAYNYIVPAGDEGLVFEGRGLRYGNGANTPTAHGKQKKLSNGNTVSICLTGNHMSEMPFLEQQTVLLYEYIATLSSHLPAGHPVVGHRDVSATSCPGDRLYREITGTQQPDILPAVDATGDKVDKVAEMLIQAANILKEI